MSSVAMQSPGAARRLKAFNDWLTGTLPEWPSWMPVFMSSGRDLAADNQVMAERFRHCASASALSPGVPPHERTMSSAYFALRWRDSTYHVFNSLMPTQAETPAQISGARPAMSSEA